jgi:lipoic acid synthetase
MPVMRKPSWVFPKPYDFAGGHEVRRLMRGLRLATVCESARCPNRGECLGAGTATFLILGEICTRRCGFCAIAKGEPGPPDPGEPAAVAEAVRRLGLAYAVVTSVTRDDLADGGAGQFAATILAIRGCDPAMPPHRGGAGLAAQPAPGRGGAAPSSSRERNAAAGARAASDPSVEVLIPDFNGAPEALDTVLAAGPAVLNHNIETVPRLYPRVRPLADYPRSLALLRLAREIAPAIPTKSGLMVGFGEQFDEVVAVMRDLAAAGVGSLTIGQYLQPARESLPVARYWHPEEFEALAAAGRGAGLGRVTAGPLVRSSYRAREAYRPGAGILPG